MTSAVLIDLRDLDARERGNTPTPDAIPFDLDPDDPLVRAIRVVIDTLRDDHE